MKKYIDVFKVQSDRATGEWLTIPEWKQTTKVDEWHCMEDTEDIHYDTFESQGKTCAIEVHWKD